ncbi:uncharacterized protein LOC126854641 [Cataglyphis hispanica]|uniref:uncharacterized protein LOC126854641 n=1 Tax=Cataglyphis hispanica TaxID=1086592 RepID=UPI0021801BEC|nr:uncharacterized protein LOC126854641 [Cataglyphis hispanica]
MFSINELFDWAGSNLAQKNYKNAEQILAAGHLIRCGKNIEKVNSDVVSFTALCLQSSHVKEKPHEIEGLISKSGKFLSVNCSCKAGKGAKCKHVVAALLYCYRCEWKNKQDRILKEYNLTSIHQHACFSKVKRKCQSNQDARNDPVTVNNSVSEQDYNEDLDEVHEGEVFEEVVSTSAIKRKYPGWSTVKSLTEDQRMLIVEKVQAKLKDSAFVKHYVGRHEPIVIDRNQNLDVSDMEKQQLKVIFTLQRSELMEDIKKWHKERRFRITGSTCYQLFTYTSNKNPDWQKKCDPFFSPKNFWSEYTDYGKKTEGEARECFRKATNKDIIETGLIICQQNPWLAYSPDGVIFKDGKPSEVLEIKCPFQGKSKDIHTVVQSVIGKFLIQDGETISLKKRHEFYGQVQLGMAVINVKKTSFVIYSSFDKRAFILTVDFDSVFVIKMLTALKKAYYQKMLHIICAIKQDSINNNQNNGQR